ncbi:MAG: RNA polymerase sigma factor [Ilumatobacteraceae bacterium]
MGGTAPAVADRRARFETVFDAAYVPVQRYVRRRGGGDETDDVVAETFTVVWRRIDEVPDSAVVPWCLGVARRCLSNQRRSTVRRKRLRDRVAAEPQAHEVSTTDLDLEVALARLDEEQREVLRLSAWEGFGAGEIAQVLGITPNAASIRLHRARRDLAVLLESGETSGKKSVDGGHTSVEAETERRER